MRLDQLVWKWRSYDYLASWAELHRMGVSIIAYSPFYYDRVRYVLSVTQRESQALKESWNDVDHRVAEEIKNSQFTAWDYGGADVIKATDRFVKVNST